MAFTFGADPVKTTEVYDIASGAASGTLTACPGRGLLKNLTVFGGVMGALSITDNTAASGGRSIINLVPATGAAATPNYPTYEFNVLCNNGISVFASAATQFYVTYFKG